MNLTRNRVVLHVDDDPQMTTLVKQQLTKHGYDVVSTNNPNQVIELLTQKDCRVVLLDIDMPEVDGLDLLETIKKFDGGIQVIMLTGVVTMTSVLQSFRRGAEACFFKPIDDFQPIVESLEFAFRKIERWWNTLENLIGRKQAAARPAQAEVTATSNIK